MSEKLNLLGEGTASNLEIDLAADSIYSILRDFKSPKDAASAFALAHYKLIKAAFPPEFKREAIRAVDAHTHLIKEFLNEGWQ